MTTVPTSEGKEVKSSSRCCLHCGFPVEATGTRGRPRVVHQECAPQYQRAYYESNKDSIANKKRAYSESNKDSIAQKQRAYYESNKDSIAQKKRAYRESNKDSIARDGHGTARMYERQGCRCDICSAEQAERELAALLG